mmetsp:Transcript_9732/g.19092  ORF Transcript_9732/g.19092 Transcript_9732/m.19092 type:complete len:161 (+) Transcript_9732:437-919(+)
MAESSYEWPREASRQGSSGLEIVPSRNAPVRHRDLVVKEDSVATMARLLPTQYLYGDGVVQRSSQKRNTRGMKSRSGIPKGKLILSRENSNPIEKRDSLRSESVQNLARGNARASVTKALESVHIMETQGLGATSEMLPGKFMSTEVRSKKTVCSVSATI